MFHVLDQKTKLEQEKIFKKKIEILKCHKVFQICCSLSWWQYQTIKKYLALVFGYVGPWGYLGNEILSAWTFHFCKTTHAGVLKDLLDQWMYKYICSNFSP